MQPGYVSPPDRRLFNAKVWEIVQMIPKGKVATYGQIANLVLRSLGISDAKGKAYGPRWVGGSLAACPDGIPWQRVVNSQGKISLRGGNELTQRYLLEMEGVMFDEQDRIDLVAFRWEGDSDGKSQ